MGARLTMSCSTQTTGEASVILNRRYSCRRRNSITRGWGISGMLRFFFFQAEDGIRDLTVTGVQTCALPIYRGREHVVVSADLVDAGHVPRLDGWHRHGTAGGARRGDARAAGAARGRRDAARRHNRPARWRDLDAAVRDRTRVHRHGRAARRRRARPEGLARKEGTAVPRWLAHLLVVLGWLFTPVLAWGASYAGLWLGAVVAARLSRPLVMLGVAALGAAIFGFAALAMWVRFMRRVPHLLSHHMAPRASEEHRAIAAAD